MPVPLVEDGVVPEVFVSGIARIERLSGGMVRITFYSERHTDQGEMEHVTAAKIISPLLTWPQALKMLSRALGEGDLPFMPEGVTIMPGDGGTH